MELNQSFERDAPTTWNVGIPKMKPTKTAEKLCGKSADEPAVVAVARDLTMTVASTAALLAEVRTLILATRQTVAQGVNSALVLLY